MLGLNQFINSRKEDTLFIWLGLFLCIDDASTKQFSHHTLPR